MTAKPNFVLVNPKERDRYTKLPSEIQFKVSYDQFIKNADLIELVVETMKNIAIGRHDTISQEA
jgi:hypothetical protein